MSRRLDLLRQLVATTRSGSDSPNQEKYLAATAELILTDLINIAINGIKLHGAGTLMINPGITLFMSEQKFNVNQEFIGKELKKSLLDINAFIDEFSDVDLGEQEIDDLQISADFDWLC